MSAEAARWRRRYQRLRRAVRAVERHADLDEASLHRAEAAVDALRLHAERNATYLAAELATAGLLELRREDLYERRLVRLSARVVAVDEAVLRDLDREVLDELLAGRER